MLSFRPECTRYQNAPKRDLNISDRALPSTQHMNLGNQPVIHNGDHSLALPHYESCTPNFGIGEQSMVTQYTKPDLDRAATNTRLQKSENANMNKPQQQYPMQQQYPIHQQGQQQKEHYTMQGGNFVMGRPEGTKVRSQQMNERVPMARAMPF